MLTDPNTDLMMHVHSKSNLRDVVQGICSINDTILKGSYGVGGISGSNDVEKMQGLNNIEQSGIIDAFNDLLNDWGYLIIDIATGLSEGVLGFTRSARDVIMVICNEPISIAGTYALIKLSNQRHHLQQFHVLVNGVRTKNEGSRVYNKLLCITEKFLDVRLNYIGAISFDNMVHNALKARKLIMAAYTESSAATAI